ncbi:16S rRNA (uracil(1498)-N(3))-methyltransferase [Chloroflexus sp. Y-396-1]|uniref:16S rRNA (uracil(1498)-N(3))-methyltransferase n=1 Tax=Chloroflexus sp. Y-396-1 TaxID=867845 RepID=UPI00048D652D|nr:16S rRNA (uracil(1498)-N(3))-methyltransferase [Chloroflexus sp. Y-396-1]
MTDETFTIPNTRRFFVNPSWLSTDQIEIDDPALIHQWVRVLRLRTGDRVMLLDGQGMAAVAEITHLDRRLAHGQIIARCQATGEPAVIFDLYLALIRHERFEWALQKAVELGVHRIVPVVFARSLTGDRVDAHRLARWQRIVTEAAEQSGRGRLPLVCQPQPFLTAIGAAHSADLAILLDEQATTHLRAVLQQQPLLRQIAIYSGPEGGIEPYERAAASDHGIQAVSLGPRILRAETAPMAALAMLQYALHT